MMLLRNIVLTALLLSNAHASEGGIEAYECVVKKNPSEKVNLKLMDATLLQVRFLGSAPDQYYALTKDQPDSYTFKGLYLGAGNLHKGGFKKNSKTKNTLAFSTEEEGTSVTLDSGKTKTVYNCK